MHSSHVAVEILKFGHANDHSGALSHKFTKLWERLSIAIFFGLANGNVDNFHRHFSIPPWICAGFWSMAPWPVQQGWPSLTASTVAFGAVWDERFNENLHIKIRTSQQIQMDLAPFGRFGIEENRCEMPMQNHGVQNASAIQPGPSHLAPERSEEFFILLTDDLSCREIQHHATCKAPVA